MNENLDLVKILKNVPKGTKLWSPICGVCELFTVNVAYGAFPIVCIGIDDGLEWHFKANGTFTNNTGVECLLFPSRENRDWSTFKVPNKHKHFEPYQKVLVKVWTDSKTRRWVPINYGYYDASKNMHFLSNFTFVEDCGIIPYEGNENKLGTIAK